MPAHLLILAAALAAAVAAQGGFYPPGRILSATLAGLALTIALRTRISPPVPLLLAASGLAGWALARGIMNGALTSGIPWVASIFCLVAAVLVTQRADPAQRDLCARMAIGIGAFVALTGWLAVVFRISAWSTVADGLVRAASTLTYPNSAAALLAALALLSISRPRSPGYTFALLVGLGATLSRAGIIALVAGLVVLTALHGIRRTARGLVPPAIGALLAVAALVPSFPADTPARPALALLGVAAGLAVTLGLDRLPAKALLLVATIGTALAVVAVLMSGHSPLASRAGINSPDRAAATDAALHLVTTRPLIGVGPGRTWLYFTTADGHAQVIRFVHNEYLQTLLELGAIGAALLLCLLTGVVFAVRRRQATPLWAGALAGLTALIVHSGFDFLWHIPAILLTAGLLLGLAGPPVKQENQAKGNT